MKINKKESLFWGFGISSLIYTWSEIWLNFGFHVSAGLSHACPGGEVWITNMHVWEVSVSYLHRSVHIWSFNAEVNQTGYRQTDEQPVVETEVVDQLEYVGHRQIEQRHATLEKRRAKSTEEHQGSIQRGKKMIICLILKLKIVAFLHWKVGRVLEWNALCGSCTGH